MQSKSQMSARVWWRASQPLKFTSQLCHLSMPGNPLENIFVFTWMYPHPQQLIHRKSQYSIHLVLKKEYFFILRCMLAKQQIYTILYNLFLDMSGELLCCLVFTHHWLPLSSFLPHPGTLAFGLFVKRYTSLTPQGMKLRNGRFCTPPYPPSLSLSHRSCLAYHW